MKKEIAAMLDWFCLVLGLALLVLVILSDVGILFASERNYLTLYIAEALLIGSTVMRIIRRKTEVVEEVEEEE